MAPVGPELGRPFDPGLRIWYDVYALNRLRKSGLRPPQGTCSCGFFQYRGFTGNCPSSLRRPCHPRILFNNWKRVLLSPRHPIGRRRTLDGLACLDNHLPEPGSNVLGGTLELSATGTRGYRLGFNHRICNERFFARRSNHYGVIVWRQSPCAGQRGCFHLCRAPLRCARFCSPKVS